MKKLLLPLLLLVSFAVVAQTDGLHYQAVIIDPNVQELPGQNATGNILPNADVTLRFTILDASGNPEYTEIQNTRTDAYGMVNVIIGQGQPQGTNSFTEIFWDGRRKDLKVEIQFDGRFTDLSNQALTFIPYAFHRDIIATGTLNVDGNVQFDGNLVVDGTTNLNNNLSVNNESPTELSGSLTVDGTTDLNSSLDVNNQSPTYLTGTLEVDGATDLNNTLEVDGATTLNNTLLVEGAVQMNSTLDVDGATQLNSSLEVDGATQLNNTLQVQNATQLNSTLEVDGATTLNNRLDVTNESPTRLTGTLTVDGITNLNSDVNINNNSSLNVSGDMVVQGSTLFEDDLIVEGNTDLNGALNVNNNSPTNLSGTLTVAQEATLGNALNVDGPTNVESILNVNNQSPTLLSGSLTVDLGTELNSSLSVNNGSPTFLSGTLEVDGAMSLNSNLTVNGVTNLNSFVFVNNGAPTNLSGDLTVGGDTDMDGTLIVDGATTLNEGLTVANASDTYLSGSLTVDEATTLNNSLDVTNASPSILTGTLSVVEATTLNSDLEVANGSPTLLTGTLNVDGATTLNSSLDVLNGSESKLTGSLTVDGATDLNADLTVLDGSPTQLSGTLEVLGETNLENTLTVAGATTINNDLSVTGNTFLGNLSTESINITGDNPNYVATFENTNAGDGDGIAIRLGKNHGAWDGTQILKIVNPLIGDPDAGIPPVDPTYQSAINVVKTQFQSPGSFSVSDMINLAPGGLRSGGILAVNEFVFQQMNSSLGLPKNLPGVNFPFTTLAQSPPPPPPFPGVEIPFVNVTIPGWQVPTVSIPSQVLNSPIGNFIPSLPILGDNTGGLPGIEFPAIPTQAIAGSLNKNNEYVSFQDKDGRVTGSIRAQSLQDFANETICNPVYLMNVISKFIGVDLLDKVVAGSVEMTNLIDKFNQIGVEYTSGNGDYAEWLPRLAEEEYITAGDIVAVKGGYITKDLQDVEQIMVVSHRPIILGNTPDPERTHLGNNVAFMGQVPVKVMGPIETGDYIVAHPTVKGYGMGKSQTEMQPGDFVLAVGRSWEENLNDGPKMVNTVVGVHNGDWVQIVQKLQRKQQAYEAQFKAIEDRVNALDEKATTLLGNN